MQHPIFLIIKVALVLGPLYFSSVSVMADSFCPISPAKSKHSVCIEEMPSSLSDFQSERCKTEGISEGKTCLDAYDRWYEKSLEGSDPDAHKKYIEFKQLLDSGNSQACLRYQNCVLKRPSEKFLDRTQAIGPFIIKTARYYGVPPEAIACSIAGDATTTSKAYPNQSLYDNPMIQTLPVQEAQRDLEEKNLRFQSPPQPSVESGVTSLTEREVSSIRNAALIIRHAAVTYESSGFQKSDLSPAVLASIYHLGVYRGGERTNWAQKTKTEDKKPGPSFIGLFCERYIATFRLKLGLQEGATQSSGGSGSPGIY